MPFDVAYPRDTAEMCEGEPFFTLARYTLQGEAPFAFDVRAFTVLPPADAVGLLNGDDETGLVVWAGALAMAEWLVRNPQRLDAALQFPSGSGGSDEGNRVLILELGSGSGVLAVALHKLVQAYLAQLPATATPLRVELVATDGNEACVALCRRNLQEQCSGVGAAVSASAAALQWGSTASVGDLATHLALCDKLLVVSADVIYDAAAVPLLMETVEKLCLEHAATSREGRSIEWWLLYTPRSLTKASNIDIYVSLKKALAVHTAWQVEQLPIPPGCFNSGFDGADEYALMGCIFAIHIL